MMFNSRPDFGSVIKEKILDAVPVAGGDIGRSYRVTTSAGELFVKQYSNSGQPGMEAHGISAMAATGTVTVPEVVNHDEHFLVLRYIKQAPKCSDFQARLGYDLARMHRVSAEAQQFIGYGFYEDNFIGSTMQINSRRDSWTDFFIENRIGYQIKLSSDRELLESWNKLSFRLPELLAGTEESPCLIHGDLWGGNVISGPDGGPVLIDPAAYYGHREMDLGMTKLFGGFTADFYKAYESEYPLKSGWQSRMNMYILYHVLNHFNMFGGGYRTQALGLMHSYL